MIEDLDPGIGKDRFPGSEVDLDHVKIGERIDQDRFKNDLVLKTGNEIKKESITKKINRMKNKVNRVKKQVNRVKKQVNRR